MAKRRAKRGGKRIADPSGDDRMVNGKLTDPMHDDYIVGKRTKKRSTKRGEKRTAKRKATRKRKRSAARR